MATDNQKAVTLVPIAIGDQEAFIRANQEAFNAGFDGFFRFEKRIR